MRLLTVWRHGEALPGRPDHSRSLSDRGRRDLEIGAAAFLAWLERRGLTAPDRLLFSRWLRTAQTSELLGAHWGLSGEAEESLIPGSAPMAVEAVLESTEIPAEHCVLVSHQPLVSTLVNRWLGDDRVPPLTPGAFATLSLGSLQVPAPAALGLVGWAMPPGYAPAAG